MGEYEVWVDTEIDRAKIRFVYTEFTEVEREVPPATPEMLEKASADREEILILLRDPNTLENFKARVIVASNPEDLPESDKLWLVSGKGLLNEEPWGVKVLEWIKEEAEEVKALPHRKPSLAERKGRILIDLLKEREAKEKKEGK